MTDVTECEQPLEKIVEAALLAAGGIVSLEQLLKLFPSNKAPTKKELQDVMGLLQEKYIDRGVELVEVASGYRFQVRKELSPWIIKLWEEKSPRYSRALLETLSIIAYRQPITRSEIEDIRGVAVSSHMVKTLEEREWVRVVGYRDVPGKPGLLATTRSFLDYFNLTSLGDLPALIDLKDMDILEETIGKQMELEMVTSEVLGNVTVGMADDDQLAEPEDILYEEETADQEVVDLV